MTLFKNSNDEDEDEDDDSDKSSNNNNNNSNDTTTTTTTTDALNPTMTHFVRQKALYMKTLQSTQPNLHYYIDFPTPFSP